MINHGLTFIGLISFLCNAGDIRTNNLRKYKLVGWLINRINWIYWVMGYTYTQIRSSSLFENSWVRTLLNSLTVGFDDMFFKNHNNNDNDEKIWTWSPPTCFIISWMTNLFRHNNLLSWRVNAKSDWALV